MHTNTARPCPCMHSLTQQHYGLTNSNSSSSNLPMGLSYFAVFGPGGAKCPAMTTQPMHALIIVIGCCIWEPLANWGCFAATSHACHAPLLPRH